MKVVHVTSHLIRKAAGVREVVLELSRAQIALGIDVSVVGLDDQGWIYEKDDWSGVPVHACSVLGSKSFGYSPEMLKTLKKIKPDIVHLHGLWMHPGRSVLRWHLETGGPYIVSPHGMLSNVALSYSPVKKKIASLLFQNKVFDHAGLVHATCIAEKNEFLRYGLSNQSVVIPNGISEMNNKDSENSVKRTILSLGRIHKKKALDQLIQAWNTLENKFPDWNLEVVGPDEEGESLRLKELIEELGLQRAKVRVPVYGEEKIKLMANAGIFALPTKSENFALTVAESLMLCVPVVSSKGAPWEGLEVERCGRWVEFGWRPMAIALEEMMLLSDDERIAMGRRGRIWMQREFSWNSIVRRLSDVYSDTVINNE